jgi:hypothetical protein
VIRTALHILHDALFRMLERYYTRLGITDDTG